MRVLLRAVRARWRLASVLLALTVAGLGAGVVILPWTYQGEASMVLLSSRIVAKQAGGNPYLVFASSLTVSAEVVGRRLMDDQTVQSLRKQGYTSHYTVGVAPDSAGPVLSITATGSDPRTTGTTLKALIAAVNSQLETLQSGLKPDARITADVVSSTGRPLRVRKPKIQLLGELLAAALGASAGLLLLVHALADRRRGTGPPAAPPRSPDVPAAPPRSPDVPAGAIDYEAIWLESRPGDPGHQRADDHA